MRKFPRLRRHTQYEWQGLRVHNTGTLHTPIHTQPLAHSTLTIAIDRVYAITHTHTHTHTDTHNHLQTATQQHTHTHSHIACVCVISSNQITHARTHIRTHTRTHASTHTTDRGYSCNQPVITSAELRAHCLATIHSCPALAACFSFHPDCLPPGTKTGVKPANRITGRPTLKGIVDIIKANCREIARI